MIWVKDITNDFAPMNEVWNEWIGGENENKGARACVEANMARPGILVEVRLDCS